MIQTLLIIGVLQAVAIVTNIVRAKIVSLSLGPEGLGIVGTIDQLVQSVVQVSLISLPATGLRFLSRSHSDGPDAFRRTYASFFKAVLLLSIGGAGLTFGVVSLRPEWLGPELALHRVAVRMALLTVPGVALGLLLGNVLAASQRPTGASAVQCAMGVVMAASAWIGIHAGGVRDIYLSALIGGLAIVGGVLVYLRQTLGLPLFDRSANVTDELRRSPDLLQATLMIYAALSTYSVSLLAPRFVALRTLGTESTGLLQSLLSVALSIGVVLSAMTQQYLVPVLNRRSTDTVKLTAAASFQRRQLLLLALMTAPIVFFPELVLRILFSSRFVGAAPWVAAFLLWQVIVLQASVLQQLLFSFAEQVPMAIISASGYVLTIVLCFLLIPPYGLTGAAVALITGASLVAGASTVWLHRQHGFTWQRRIVWLSLYILGGFSSAVVLAAVGTSGGWGGAMRFGVCMGFVAGLIPFLDVEEQHYLLRLWGHVVRWPARAANSRG